MTPTLTISLLLLALVGLDATGDAFRFLNRQVLHHAMEVLMIAGFIALWAFFPFEPVYIIIYILGRLWLFDVLWNVITGQNPLYIGTSDLYGRSVRWIGEKLRVSYMHFSFMIKFMSFMAWIGLIIRFK